MKLTQDFENNFPTRVKACIPMCIRQKQNRLNSPVLKIVPVVARPSLPMVGKKS